MKNKFISIPLLILVLVITAGLLLTACDDVFGIYLLRLKETTWVHSVDLYDIDLTDKPGDKVPFFEIEFINSSQWRWFLINDKNNSRIILMQGTYDWLEIGGQLSAEYFLDYGEMGMYQYKVSMTPTWVLNDLEEYFSKYIDETRKITAYIDRYEKVLYIIEYLEKTNWGVRRGIILFNMK